MYNLVAIIETTFTANEIETSKSILKTLGNKLSQVSNSALSLSLTLLILVICLKVIFLVSGIGRNGSCMFSKVKVMDMLKELENDSSVEAIYQNELCEHTYKIQICKSADYGEEHADLTRYQLKVYKDDFKIDQMEYLTKEELIDKVLDIKDIK